jgi:hypothetical protein
MSFVADWTDDGFFSSPPHAFWVATIFMPLFPRFIQYADPPSCSSTTALEASKIYFLFLIYAHSVSRRR